MSDGECIAFLQWALPLMGFHWPGFRKVHGRVCKRIARRCAALGLADAAAYRRYLEAHGEEWENLRALCAVAISRFYRDRGVFEALEASVLPARAAAAARYQWSSVKALPESWRGAAFEPSRVSGE